MRGSLWCLLLIALNASAGTQFAAHMKRVKEAWNAAEKAGNISAARILVHFTQARKSASKLFARAARSGDIATMELLVDVPLLNFDAALEAAVRAGTEDAVDFIIRHARANEQMDGAVEIDLNKALVAAGIEGKTPVKTAEFLLARGASDIDYLLIVAARENPKTLRAFWHKRENLDIDNMLTIAAAATNDERALSCGRTGSIACLRSETYR